MKHCLSCLMPDTKPGLVLDKDGVCQACRHYEKRDSIDWDKRFQELKELSSRYRTTDGGYDCIVAVSGGKDSHFQVYVMKELLGMNPLLVAVGDPFSKTEAGRFNLENIGKVFGCDLISLSINPQVVKRMSRIGFEEFGMPNWPIDRAIYVFPVKMAVKMNIPLLVYGENVNYEYGGIQQEETYSAKDQINNGLASNVDLDFWLNKGISENDINMFKYPSVGEIGKVNLEPIYLSYFMPWDGYNNYQIAKRYGFRDLSDEWIREGYLENYDQIDTIGALIHVWMKYPKFGFARATDMVGYWIRSGKITREEGIKLIRENDHKLDKKIIEDFLRFSGYNQNEFWGIVDKFWNRDIFEKVNGRWRMKADGFSKLSVNKK